MVPRDLLSASGRARMSSRGDHLHLIMSDEHGADAEGAAAHLRRGPARLCGRRPGRVTFDRPLARKMDRLVLLVPANPIALVTRATEHLDDLAATRSSATDLVDRDPVAGSDAGTMVDGV
jgi:hypothetical protein